MANKLKKACRNKQCPNLTLDAFGYCPQCKPVFMPDVDRGNETIKYDAKWERLRKVYLARHPLCKACEAAGFVSAATEVDHIQPWREGQSEELKYKLFYDWHNLQALCKPCHSRKTFNESQSKGRK